ncbi:hypothetical protein PoB_000062200 [Plakobranchus ocellatus]|uniref:Uncharacterized protein n=1 Tax=Plakobranchus ocellatus TaxID=259542 RepID=A0AAV3XUC4_9GAST|nr:hypothetical protein PoB_000062200 [Plakobranchus ocellatus]
MAYRRSVRDIFAITLMAPLSSFHRISSRGFVTHSALRTVAISNNTSGTDSSLSPHRQYTVVEDEVLGLTEAAYVSSLNERFVLCHLFLHIADNHLL